MPTWGASRMGMVAAMALVEGDQPHLRRGCACLASVSTLDRHRIALTRGLAAPAMRLKPPLGPFCPFGWSSRDSERLYDLSCGLVGFKAIAIQ
jgi:hypothetical protein